MQGSQSKRAKPTSLPRLGWLVILWGGLLGGCSDDPVSTVPLDGTAVGTRTATPTGQAFSDVQPGRDPRTKHLWASFVISPEQLQSAREAPITLNPQAILPCADCDTIQWHPGSPPPTPASRGLGSYTPTSLSLSLRLVPEERQTRLSSRFELDTTTQLIHPGEGVRLTLQQARWGELPLEPLPQPLDFTASQITRGQLQERTWTLPFSLSEANDLASVPPLQLDLLLTSPIPPDVAPFQRGKPLPPPAGKLYHATTWPGSPTREQLYAYQQAIGQPPAWVEVEHSWDPRQDFPQPLANRIRESGSVPYLHLRFDQANLSSLAAGEQDETIRSWAEAIQRFATPVILAVSVADVEAAELQAAYRHLMQTLRSEKNLLWVLELAGDDPEAVPLWAGFGGMDWLSVQLDGDPSGFEELYRRLAALNPKMPILLEGISLGTEGSESVLEGLETQQWPQVIGWSWALGAEGIPPQSAQAWRQHLQSSDSNLWLGEIRVQPSTTSPTPTASPTP